MDEQATNPNPKTAVRDGYNRVADAYSDFAIPRPTETRANHVSHLLDALPPGASILELGCGPGVPCTQQFVAHGLAVTAVDISAAQIALAKKRIPAGSGVEFVVADMTELAFPDGAFDAVVAFYSVFHLPRREQGGMVEKMARWLRPGGLLLFNLSTDEGETWHWDWLGPGVSMFSAGLGIEGNRVMMRGCGRLVVIEDEVAVERVGRSEVKFHWFLARKE